MSGSAIDEGSVTQAINALRDEIIQRHEENAAVNAEQTDKLDEVIRRVDGLQKGFPDNDPDGHRRAHEAMIARDKARTALYNALRQDLVTKGLYAFIGAVMLGLWWWFKERIKS